MPYVEQITQPRGKIKKLTNAGLKLQDTQKKILERLSIAREIGLAIHLLNIK